MKITKRYLFMCDYTKKVGTISDRTEDNNEIDINNF